MTAPSLRPGAERERTARKPALLHVAQHRVAERVCHGRIARRSRARVSGVLFCRIVAQERRRRKPVPAHGAAAAPCATDGVRSSCRARASAHLIVPARRVLELRGKAELAPGREVDRDLRGDVGDRVAVAGDVAVRRELAVEGGEEALHALAAARRQLRDLREVVGAGERAPGESPGRRCETPRRRRGSRRSRSDGSTSRRWRGPWRRCPSGAARGKRPRGTGTPRPPR